MAMTVINNPSAMMSLGELNKNVSKLGKQLAKVSSGQKIIGAGDGASEYAISEKMRVRVRALDRDEANVNTGISMLNVAAGGIQQQIELMKIIKARVIDADNDSNTDIDRLTIQKEISQNLEEINDIAYETNYNGKLLLVGNKEVERVQAWHQYDKPQLVEESDLHLIADVYDVLDGIEGPFDTLPFWNDVPATAEPLLGDNTEVSMAGGTKQIEDEPANATTASFTMDFSNYANGEAANGVGFYTSADGGANGVKYYVLTTDTSKHYKYGDSENVIEIDVSGCTTSAEIAAKVADEIEGTTIIGSANASGSEITVTTAAYGTKANNYTVAGWSESSDTKPQKISGSPQRYGRTGAVPTELSIFQNVSKSISASGIAPVAPSTIPAVYEETKRTIEKYNPETDETTYEDVTEKKLIKEETYVPGKEGTTAKLNINLSTTEEGTGFRIKGSGGDTAYVRFVRGEGGSFSEIPRDSSGVYVFDLNANYDEQTLCIWDELKNDTNVSSYVKVSYDGDVLKLESVDQGGTITVTDGFADNSDGAIAPQAGTPDKYVPLDFEEVYAYTGVVSATTGGKDKGPVHPGEVANYSVDLTAYDVMDTDKLENFIEALKGKNLDTWGTTWEFIDKKVPTSYDAMKHSSATGSHLIDLNEIRTAVSGGTTIADAFIGLMCAASNTTSYTDPLGGGIGAQTYYVDCFEDASTGTSKILKINASEPGLGGNSETVSIGQVNWSAYTIDFSNVVGIPENLYNKGFRVYCATCPEQWMNFQFVDGNDDGNILRPQSLSGSDFKTTFIDVSGVTDVKSLVQAIYEQGDYGLAHMRNDKRHFLHFAADPEAGKLTVYDDRTFDLRSRPGRYKHLQEKGAKLADGLYDDVHRMTRKIYVNDLVIHHTDKASMNIHLQIPQTSMDHLFGYFTKLNSYKDYDVLTVAHREELLGNQAGRMSRDGTRMITKDEPGLLDKAIQYLADAATMVGAQTSRLETTRDNIIVQQESTAASESTIRDADMAKEFTEYTKSNILTQSAQAMLAQANQNSSSVLSLLE